MLTYFCSTDFPHCFQVPLQEDGWRALVFESIGCVDGGFAFLFDWFLRRAEQAWFLIRTKCEVLERPEIVCHCSSVVSVALKLDLVGVEVDIVDAHDVGAWRPQEAEYLEIRLLQGGHRGTDRSCTCSTSSSHLCLVLLGLGVSQHTLGPKFELLVVPNSWLETALVLAFLQRELINYLLRVIRKVELIA